MKKFKLGVALALAACMVFGCGKKSDDKKATPSDATASESDAGYVAENLIEDDGNWPTTEVPVPEVERFATVEGADAIGRDFEDGKQDFVAYTNGGSYELEARDGWLCCDVASLGRVEHGNQVYFDGFTMAKDCVYSLEFDIDCTIPRSVQWRVQINGGDYHAYAADYIDIGPETLHVSKEFTMSEDSDPAPRFVINFGSMDGNDSDVAHTMRIDNVSLIVVDGSKAEKIEGAPTPIQVKVNQIGYKPTDKKTVVTTSGEEEKFKITNLDTDEVVYVGSYTDFKYDSDFKQQYKHGDFSALTEPGRYQVLSSPSGLSYEFYIGEGLYDEVYKDVIRMLYSQRCGIALDDNIVGAFAHEACHTQEAYVYGDDSGKTYDVSGGWHDAGDYGKYVVPGAKTVMDLLLAYEDYGCDLDNVGIPESGNGVPDLLDEAKVELDFFFKMQAPEGGVYHKVTGIVFPETVGPCEETCDLYLSQISYAATADFAAVMAKASVVYADYDADYAAKCLEASKKAYDYLNSGKVEMKTATNPGDIVTGSYNDNALQDELMWAAAELYIATGDESYLKTVKETRETNYKTGLGWASVATYALYDLAKNGSDDALATECKNQILEILADKMTRSEKSAANVYPDGGFVWGSNMGIANDGMLYLMAYQLTGDKVYLEYANYQRDYIFGVNGTGYCYVTGYGTLSPNNIHHRPSQVVGNTFSGMLVGGPNGGLNDPYSEAVLYDYGPAQCYVDNSQSFATNEICIYWNSPLIYLLTGLK